MAQLVDDLPRDATARPGPGDDSKLLLRLPLADFLRLAAGTVDPLLVFLDGRAEIEGDLDVARRLPEMFGGRRRTDPAVSSRGRDIPA